MEKEQLKELNSYLQELRIHQRWRSVDEAVVYRKRNMAKVYKSKEFIQIIIYFLILATRLHLLPFILNTREGIFTVFGIYALYNANLFLQFSSQKPPASSLSLRFLKEIVTQSVIIIGINERQFDLEVPPNLIELCGMLVYGVIIMEYNLIFELQLEYELALKIHIEGKELHSRKDWKVTRLEMMSPKATKLLEYYTKIHSSDQKKSD